MTIEEVTAENESLRAQLQQAKDDLAIAVEAQARIQKSFEAQQRMHEAGVERVKELSAQHKAQHEADEAAAKTNA